METYEFIITLVGSGSDIDEAWIDASEGFSLDPGDMDADKNRCHLIEKTDD